MNRPGLWITIVIALTACGDGGDASVAATASIDTLPNGAIRVRNSATGAWDSASIPRYREIVRIGSFEGDGPDVFAEIRDLEVDALGRVWVLDAQLKKIEVFDADGRHVRTVGRQGSGPGELEQPNGIEFDAQGRLWVQDPRNTRFTVFDTSGALIATHRRDSMLYSWIWPGGITDDGRIFDIDIVIPDGPQAQSRQVLVERDTSGAAIDTIELPAFEPDVYEMRNEAGQMSMTTSVPFAPVLEWGVAPDATFWHGITGDYRVVQQTLDGDTLRIVEKEWTPIGVRPGERDSMLQGQFLDEMRAGGADIDASRVPANKPAWSDFWFDDRGNLWVRPVAETRGAVDVFDREGVYQGRLQLPPGMGAAPTPVVRGDLLYGVVRDEVDVQYVVIARAD